MTKEEFIADIQDGTKTWDKSVIKDVPVFFMDYLYRYLPGISDEDFDTANEKHLNTEKKGALSRLATIEYEDFSQGNIMTLKSFQSGRNSIMEAIRTVTVLKHFFLSETLSSLTFLGVPASEQERQQKRFESLSKWVCSKCNMANGYEHVFVRYRWNNKTNRFGKKDYNDVATFDEKWFQGRNVILLDSIIYSGDSIRSLKNKLEKMGAKVIGAIIIIKEVHKRSEKSPYYLMDKSVKPQPKPQPQPQPKPQPKPKPEPEPVKDYHTTQKKKRKSTFWNKLLSSLGFK